MKYRVESAGTVFEVVVELTPDGLSFDQRNTRAVHAWRIVDEIEEDRGDVVFHVRYGNILIVRRRAFESDEARRMFVEKANQLRAASSLMHRAPGLSNSF